ncbi:MULTISPECIES: SpoIIE family protein phosphatase [Streptomyces]|uniref:SpoIIE family protein phosphatase n=1 Tax=Streptomyces TaxID=1883 RepID=UPI00224953FF|nr:SpoIIE family protein phosphatase [Streptomyces sp. JHD 1]MCX2968388.1 SpoIIE family protein phosphatase [Streptomyces sp. JHD 1]
MAQDAGHEGADFARQLMDQVFLQLLRDTGAHVGGVYLLEHGGQLLNLDVLSGVPPEVAELWARLHTGVPLPVADAVRTGDLVWVGGEGEMARRYPRAALVLPYPFKLAAAPLVTEAGCWGAVLLLWPGARPEVLEAGERARIAALSGRLARLLHVADEAGERIRTGDRPRGLPGPWAGAPDEGRGAGAGAAAYLQRLPEGACALDLDGRVTFVTARAAELLGTPAERLLGARPWELLTWLDDPVYEDRYRAALVSREAVSFVAGRAPGGPLAFELHPDADGISVRVTRFQGTDTHAPPTRPPTAGPGRAGTLYHLMHLAGALTEAVGVRDVVDLVADHILPAYDAQALALLVTEDGRLRIVGSHGYSARTRERFHNMPVSGRTPAGQALTTGVPSFFASREELEDAYPATIGMASRAAWAFLPLIASGRPVGCWLIAYDQPHPFSAEERAALTSLSGLVAQALDRARTYDRQYRIARGLQSALLPHTLPSVPGLEVAARYLPATHGMDIGGDFYDVIPLRGAGAGAAAVIGDVQGHNVTAAALMGQVRTAVHAHASSGASPREVLARTNRLLNDLEPELFTSCLYARLDVTGHQLCLASAGHPPPLLRHPDGRTEVLRPAPGLLLGIVAETPYEQVELALPPGAVLVFYTDGLVESPGADPDDVLEDLAAHLSRTPARSLDPLADDLLQHARRYAGEHTDDVALLLLRLT